MESLACTYRRQGRLEDVEALQVIVDEEEAASAGR